MLEIFGTIAGSILNLPGILGLLLGMMTRNLLVGSALGALVGVLSTVIFYSGLNVSAINMTELLIAVLVGAVFGCIGSIIRIKGATV